MQVAQDGEGPLAREIHRDYEELRWELGQLERALEDLDVREDVTSVVEFLLRFEKRIRHHFRGEEQLLLARYGQKAACVPLRVLAAELDGFQELAGDLRALIGLARKRDPAVREALRLAGRRFRVAIACHACHAERGAAVPIATSGGT